ncbi:MAG TPA: tetratricopeptide repeat protein, partial [Bacillota bacterium]
RSLRRDDSRRKAPYWGILAKIYRNLWALNQADKYYRLYLKLSMQENNVLQVGYGHMGLGLNYYQQGDQEKALDSTEKALSIFESMGNESLRFAAKLNIACIYNAMSRHDLSLKVLQSVLAGNLPVDSAILCKTYQELAKTHLRLGAIDGFFQARERAGDYAVQSKSLVEMGRVTMLDAEWFWSQGQNKKAIQSLRKAIMIFRNHGAAVELRPAEKLLMTWVKGGDSE